VNGKGAGRPAGDHALSALAALAFQRLVLGLSDDLGALALGGGAPLVRCEAHRG
jgi:hypothetical protein